MILTIHPSSSFKLKLKVGDKVDFDTPLYEEKKTEEAKLVLSEKLGVSPDKIFHHLKKFVGDGIVKGDLIAEKKSFLDNRRVLSDIDGILREINHNEGYILIDSSSTETKVKNCFFKGEISSLDKNEIKIKVGSHKDYPIKETINMSEEYIGYKVYYLNDKYGEFTSDDVSGKLVVCANLASYYQIKLEALGATGFVGIKSLVDPTFLPVVSFKNFDDIKQVFKANLPYCIIDKKAGKIVFYE